MWKLHRQKKGLQRAIIKHWLKKVKQISGILMNTLMSTIEHKNTQINIICSNKKPVLLSGCEMWYRCDTYKYQRKLMWKQTFVNKCLRILKIFWLNNVSV